MPHLDQGASDDTDLLRLGTGLVATDGITAELERARELSQAIEAELHARDEIRRIASS